MADYNIKACCKSNTTQVCKSCLSLSLFLTVTLSFLLALLHAEDASASPQGRGPNVKSIVLFLPSGDRVTSTHVPIYTHTGAQVVCCSGLSHTHRVLNMMQHCSCRQQRLKAEKYKADIKSRPKKKKK